MASFLDEAALTKKDQEEVSRLEWYCGNFLRLIITNRFNFVKNVKESLLLKEFSDFYRR
jgi:hypothetical protein